MYEQIRERVWEDSKVEHCKHCEILTPRSYSLQDQPAMSYLTAEQTFENARRFSHS